MRCLQGTVRSGSIGRDPGSIRLPDTSINFRGTCGPWLTVLSACRGKYRPAYRIFTRACRSIFEQFLNVLAPALKKIMFGELRIRLEGHPVAPAARAIRK